MAEPPDAGGVEEDRQALLGVLVERRVELVLIGGAAIQSSRALERGDERPQPAQAATES